MLTNNICFTIKRIILKETANYIFKTNLYSKNNTKVFGEKKEQMKYT